VEIHLHEFLISALFGGEWSGSHPIVLSPEEGPQVHTRQVVGWVLEPVLTLWLLSCITKWRMLEIG